MLHDGQVVSTIFFSQAPREQLKVGVIEASEEKVYGAKEPFNPFEAVVEENIDEVGVVEENIEDMLKTQIVEVTKMLQITTDFHKLLEINLLLLI